MRSKEKTQTTGSKVIRLGPICIKRYGPHKRLPSITPGERLRREIIGSKLLASQKVVVAKPWIWSEQGLWAIRRWYPGIHPYMNYRVNDTDICALADWLSEHRGKGASLPFRTDINLAILTHFLLNGIQDLNHPLVITVIEGKDLLHADLVPENILFGNNEPIILDPESVSVGNLAWDAAQIISHIFQLKEGDPFALKFLYRVGLNEAEKELVWSIVRVFMRKKK